MKYFVNSINKLYLSNTLLAAAIACSVIFMFCVQFKVEALQNKLDQTKESIVAYEDDIKLLDVEWVYLTRPERLRDLAKTYLQDNSYILANQIKGTDTLSKYYLAAYRKHTSQEMALNEKSHLSNHRSF